MRFFWLAVAAPMLGCGLGCHSAYVEAEIQNRTDRPLSLVEVDYPSASFGTQTLLPHDSFHYRFKVQGSGQTRVLWTDRAHVEHTSPGPEVKEDDEGKMTVTFRDSGPLWEKSLTNHGQTR